VDDVCLRRFDQFFPGHQHSGRIRENDRGVGETLTDACGGRTSRRLGDWGRKSRRRLDALAHNYSRSIPFRGRNQVQPTVNVAGCQLRKHRCGQPGIAGYLGLQHHGGGMLIDRTASLQAAQFEHSRRMKAPEVLAESAAKGKAHSRNRANSSAGFRDAKAMLGSRSPWDELSGAVEDVRGPTRRKKPPCPEETKVVRGNAAISLAPGGGGVLGAARDYRGPSSKENSGPRECERTSSAAALY